MEIHISVRGFFIASRRNEGGTYGIPSNVRRGAVHRERRHVQGAPGELRDSRRHLYAHRGHAETEERLEPLLHARVRRGPHEVGPLHVPRVRPEAGSYLHRRRHAGREHPREDRGPGVLHPADPRRLPEPDVRLPPVLHRRPRRVLLLRLPRVQRAEGPHGRRGQRAVQGRGPHAVRQGHRLRQLPSEDHPHLQHAPRRPRSRVQQVKTRTAAAGGPPEVRGEEAGAGRQTRGRCTSPLRQRPLL